MTTLTLGCGTNDLLVDAALSSATVNAGSLFTVNGPIKFSSLVSGLASFDVSGNLSVVAGTAFNSAANITVTGTWIFSNTATLNGVSQINNILGVTGTLTAAGALINSGITTQASVLAVPTSGPPTGYSYVIINNTTKQLYRMT